MHSIFKTPRHSGSAVPIWFVHADNYRAVQSKIGSAASAFADATGFEPKPGRYAFLPGSRGQSPAALFGIEAPGERIKDTFLPGRLADLLPDGQYRFANAPHNERLAALALALGAYRFDRYRKAEKKKLSLVLPGGVDGAELSRIVEGVELARDLINTPSNDMGPKDLEAAARRLGRTHKARVSATVGAALEKRRFPLVYAVGSGSAREPRLIDFTWGNANHPKVTLVGKGVCFDSGGLDIKPDSAMLLMKKDMGGAAIALALAHMVMSGGLKVRLRVLIPAVENSVSGSAMRPLDVYPSRKGLTVEIGNTDAEGRLVMADALALADEEKPDLLIDFGTLTGAARAALGPDLPALYSNDERLAGALVRHGLAENDPVWRMPLWPRYDSWLESKVADINNIASGGFAGSIVCALFLQRFITQTPKWIHLDLYAWTPTARPGRPEGGECQAARALYALLKEQYAG